MIKVAEWIRVSDESQAAPEKFGIPAQRSVNKETCKRFGLEVIKTFQVEDVSGKDILLASDTRTNQPDEVRTHTGCGIS